VFRPSFVELLPAFLAIPRAPLFVMLTHFRAVFQLASSVFLGGSLEV